MASEAKLLQMPEPRELLGLKTRVTARVCSALLLNALFICCPVCSGTARLPAETDN